MKNYEIEPVSVECELNIQISVFTLLFLGIIRGIERLLENSADKIADFAEY